MPIKYFKYMCTYTITDSHSNTQIYYYAFDCKKMSTQYN